jgi:hypothetical protein
MKKITFLIISLAFIYQGCDKGFVIVERSESFSDNKHELKNANIYYFEPAVTSYYIRKEVENQFLKADDFKTYIGQELSKAGRKSGIKINLLDSKTLQSDYSAHNEELLLLKKAILNATALQENAINSGRRISGDYKQRKVFVSTPRISAEFSHLSKSFSPYFGMTGVFAVDSEPESREAREFVSRHKAIRYGQYYYFYHMVINIETSEMVYREIKQVPCVISKKYLGPIIYDSYATLKQNLK